MYLKTLEANVLKYMNKILSFLICTWISMASMFKKTRIKLPLLTNVDMLFMVEKGIGGGICHAIHRYAKANNKYMNNHDENKESSYIHYLDANNLYGWAMSKKLPVGGFKWKKIC